MSVIESFLKKKKSLSSNLCRGQAFIVNQKNNNKVVEMDLSGKAKVLKVLSDKEVDDLKKMSILEKFPRSTVSFKNSQCDLIPEDNFADLCRVLKINSVNNLRQKKDIRMYK